MTTSNLSIFIQDYAPRTTRIVQTPDGTASVYSALAVGRIAGKSRTIPALVCEEISEDDRWYLVNLMATGGYLDTVAVLGATSGNQAEEWARRQVLTYLAMGDSNAYASCIGDDATASADALQEYLDSAAAGVCRLPIRRKDIEAFEGKITDRPVVWDQEWLKSHTAADLLHELARRDQDAQLMDAMMPNELPKLIEQEGGEQAEYDAIIVDYNRLELLQERLMSAMAKAAIGNVRPVNVTQTKPFKRNGVTNVAVLYELSDGQSVTIVFHSPDATPAKLGPKDTLTSWKFLLNKRDVTAAVAPENGENVQLPALAKRILLLVEKNSARFKRANGKKAEQMQQLADTNTRIEQKTATLESLNAEIDSLQKQMDAGVAAPTAEVPVAVSAAESSEYPLGKVGNGDEGRFFGTRVVVAADPEMPGDSEWQGTIYWALNDGRLFEVERDGRPGSRIRVSGNRIKVLDMKDSKSTAAQVNDGRLTPETAASLKSGDVVKTADGTEYMAMSARHDWLKVAPIVNGKAQVNNQDTFKFLLSPEKASAYPERRNEPVYPAGRNIYAEQGNATADRAPVVITGKASAEVAAPGIQNAANNARPENWRTDRDAAASVASGMGIDTKGMQLKKIVTAIETKDRESRVDAAADLIDDVLADVKAPEGFGIVFDKMREIKDAYNGAGTLSGYIILQDVSGIAKDDLSEVEVRIAVSRLGESESATGYIFEMTGPNRGFPSNPSGSNGAFTAEDSSIEGLRSMFADRLAKVFSFYADAAEGANPDADFLNAVIAGTPPDMPPNEITAKLKSIYMAAKDSGNADMLALGDKAIRAYAAQNKAKAQAKLAEVQ